MSVLFTMHAPDPPHWDLISSFGVFCSVWVYLGSFHYFMKLGAKWAELWQLMQISCHEVVSEFFATNTPDPPHWIRNWRFGTFHTIWVHSGPFGCLTKLDAKRAKLVQKFVPQSPVGICRNERTRYTPLDPKLTFWCVSYYLGAFSQQTYPIHPVGP